MKAYGAIELTEASPPQSFTEPIGLPEAKMFLRVSSSSEDIIIQRMIRAARALAEIHQNKCLSIKQYDLTLDLLLGYDAIAGAAYPMRFNSIYNFGSGNEIELRFPLRSVDLFQYADYSGIVTTLTEGTDYIMSRQRGLVLPPFNRLWPFFTPQPTSSVLIRHTSGYPMTHPFWQDTGSQVLIGMQMCIAAWYENRVPFNPDRPGEVQEYPLAATSLLSWGARPRVH